MDKIGFGPRNGFSPENLKPFADFLQEMIVVGHKKYLLDNLDQATISELRERGGRLTEIMSLFFYHL